MKYIDAELLRKKITEQMDSVPREVGRGAGTITSKGYGMMQAFQIMRSIIDSLQQEPIKVYRVENEAEQKGLWRKFDGTWEPLFDMLTDGKCRNLPMEDNDIYRQEGLRWFASAPSKETLQKWFSKKDLEELTQAGFSITEFTVLRYKAISEFEYIFPRESILATKQLSVNDIYPIPQQETPEISLEEAAEKYRRTSCNAAIKPNIDGPMPEYGGSIKAAFIAGANWQKEKDIRDMVMSDNRQFQKVYELGKKDMMEKMMKEKINGIIEYINGKEEGNESTR